MNVSVIVPTFKPQDYLWECLDSLCSQTLPREFYEVILVLNGCKEPYHTQIQTYINNNKEINWVYRQTDKGGVSNARNLALDITQGEYIAFIDDDDIISKSYLKELYERATPQNVSLCYPLSFKKDVKHPDAYYITKEYDKFSCRAPLPYYKAKRFFSGPVYKLIHKDIIGDRRYDISFKNGEDSLFMFLISDRIVNVTFTSKESVYYRRIRENSATTSDHSFFEVVKNRWRLICAYSRIFFNRPFSNRYKLEFYVSRVVASFHAIVDAL